MKHGYITSKGRGGREGMKRPHAGAVPAPPTPTQDTLLRFRPKEPEGAGVVRQLEKGGASSGVVLVI
ncbi:hypothetical protein AVEN_118527-1 [Araneus ventricosus]|uniref:Uncharacterized protein n=1 Tax=Araneus ventricosus TaxID=182803 RepID=A0A4Y2AZ14_ARAVE|nr:hypothetical protein AVEN_118527-1 [Araneus ventricosus]